MNVPARPMWHSITGDEACLALNTHAGGLTESQVLARLQDYGPNAIPHSPPPPWWVTFRVQFCSPIIYILGIAAIISALIGHTTDAGFIGLVMLINASIGGYQEHRADRSARALQQLLNAKAFVSRDGDIREMDAQCIVPGDIVWLESGNRVPADTRLLTAQGLYIDESLLTGESLAAPKEANSVYPKTITVGDRRNMAFAGSLVVRGRAKALVVETGSRTQVGQLALDVLKSQPGESPLLVRLRRFTRIVGVTVLIAAFIVGLLGVLIQEYSIAEMFMFAVALAVSAIPEGLPIAITVALAIGATRMAKHGVIVRKLGAVEGLGSCTFIACDKTGTLTCNELTARDIYLADGITLSITGEGFEPLGHVELDGKPVRRSHHTGLDALTRAILLCNEAELHQHNNHWLWRGDPTDIALLSMAHKLGWVKETTLDQYPQINQIPFEPELRYSATFNRIDDALFVFVKGAPERVLSMCSLEKEVINKFMHRAECMADRRLRVLAIATGKVRTDLNASEVPPEPTNLTFIGFIGMNDPLRPGAHDAVKACQRAGIEVSIVTGDHPTTGLAIAKELGMADSVDQVITGDSLSSLSPDELCEHLGHTRVFARVAPSQKLDIVLSAQAAGHFVAVTGDGANDAPALRAANIGVAMGRSGTDVAREAADLVICDDNLATIVGGIKEGRVAYDNIRKVIYLLVSTGAAEVILVLLAVASDSPLPLLPAQILWLNLVTNGIQDIALTFEPGEGDVLSHEPRRPTERIFNRLMIENCIYSASIMGIMGFIAFRWMLNSGWSEHSARNGLLLLMVLFEISHIGNCRSETRLAFSLSPLRSPFLLGGTAIAFALHLAMMYLPIGNSVLKTEPILMHTWGILVAVALSMFTLVQLHKWMWRFRLR